MDYPAAAGDFWDQSCPDASTRITLTGSSCPTSRASCRRLWKPSTSASRGRLPDPSGFRALSSASWSAPRTPAAGRTRTSAQSIPSFLISEYDELPTLITTRGHEIDDNAYITAIRTVIEDLANGGNVVIVGRGAHIILEDNPDVLRVGLIATFEDRVERVMIRERMSQSDAEAAILARDEARMEYFRRFFSIDDPDSAEHYHLVINTSEMNLDAATDIIIEASKELELGRLSRHAFRVEP